jgi:hypothetical protein
LRSSLPVRPKKPWNISQLSQKRPKLRRKKMTLKMRNKKLKARKPKKMLKKRAMKKLKKRLKRRLKKMLKRNRMMRSLLRNTQVPAMRSC